MSTIEPRIIDGALSRQRDHRHPQGVVDQERPLAPVPAPADSAFVERVWMAINAQERAMREFVGCKGWRSSVFEFVRLLRGDPLLVDLVAEDAADLVELALKELLLAKRLPYSEEANEDPWFAAFADTDSSGERDEDSQERFLELWDKVLPGIDLKQAYDAARRRAGMTPASTFGNELAHPRRMRYREFLWVLFELDGRWNGGVFAISVEAFAEAMGSTSQVIGGWRRKAQGDGFLVEVEPPVNQKRAGRYVVTDKLRAAAASATHHV